MSGKDLGFRRIEQGKESINERQLGYPSDRGEGCVTATFCDLMQRGCEARGKAGGQTTVVDLFSEKLLDRSFGPTGGKGPTTKKTFLFFSTPSTSRANCGREDEQLLTE